MGLIKGDTRSLDYSSCRDLFRRWDAWTLQEACRMRIQRSLSNSACGNFWRNLMNFLDA